MAVIGVSFLDNQTKQAFIAKLSDLS